jgi:hypothetical protein
LTRQVQIAKEWMWKDHAFGHGSIPRVCGNASREVSKEKERDQQWRGV